MQLQINTMKTNTPHKNKTLATFLALLFGGAGLHRFYLHGMRDSWGWLHAASLILSLLLLAGAPERALLINMAPLVLSVLASSIETFIIGLMPDEKWDAIFNAESGIETDTSWPVPLMMVANLFCGATLLLITIARAFDLMLTGGAYG